MQRDEDEGKPSRESWDLRRKDELTKRCARSPWRRFFRRAAEFAAAMEVTEGELLERRIALLEEQVRRLETLAFAMSERDADATR